MLKKGAHGVPGLLVETGGGGGGGGGSTKLNYERPGEPINKDRRGSKFTEKTYATESNGEGRWVLSGVGQRGKQGKSPLERVPEEKLADTTGKNRRATTNRWTLLTHNRPEGTRASTLRLSQQVNRQREGKRSVGEPALGELSAKWVKQFLKGMSVGKTGLFETSPDLPGQKHPHLESSL